MYRIAVAALLLSLLGLSAGFAVAQPEPDRCEQNFRNAVGRYRKIYQAALAAIDQNDAEAVAQVEAKYGDFRAIYEAEMGIGNGNIDAGEDTCVLYVDANGKARLGTRVYRLGPRIATQPAAHSLPPALTEHRAWIIRGTARIRSGPGLQYNQVGRCGLGQPLTIWRPAVNDFVRASCHNRNGWIHQSLVMTDW
ncbi:MAG: hypothetical protein OXF32_02650 [Anaerolineaceae bacterium]|nr:hypothetical protein [Anaerolineaceae bacterium]